MASGRQRQSGAATARQPTAPSSTPATTQTIDPTDKGPSLPPYQAPVAPLNEEARIKLANLLDTTYSTRKIDEALNKAASFLSESAGDINDQVRERKTLLAHRKRKRQEAQKNSSDNFEHEETIREQEAAAEAYGERVESMTVRLDQTLRKTIDGFAGSQNIEKTLADLCRTSQSSASEQAVYASQRQIQQSQTQRSRAGRRLDNEDSDAESEGDVTQIPATAAEGNQNQNQNQDASETAAPSIPQLTPRFTETLQTLTDRYTAQSLTTRYAHHNSYTQFKRVVHDAMHAENSEAHPLPSANTWFAKEEGREEPAAGATNAGADGEDDDDIAVARVKISTRCPLTYREFVDPVTSRKCQHSYERSAIEQVLREARPPEGQRYTGWVQEVACPVSGCVARVRMEDLGVDVALVRKIRRIQKTKEAQEGERDGGGDGRDVISSDVEESDVEDIENANLSTARSVKRERMRATMGEDIEDD